MNAPEPDEIVSPPCPPEPEFDGGSLEQLVTTSAKPIIDAQYAVGKTVMTENVPRRSPYVR